MIPLNVRSVEFASGLIGGALGLAVGGGPLLAAAAAVAVNYASKTDSDAGEAVQAVSRSAISVVNYATEVTERSGAGERTVRAADRAGESAMEAVRRTGKVDRETLDRVGGTVVNVADRVKEMSDEYDVVDRTKVTIEVVSDLVDRALRRVEILNREHRPVDRVVDTVKKGVEERMMQATEAQKKKNNEQEFR